ncbi:hypothetical protein ACQPZX_24260 [Actinoplanes sp. CA-142083]|uniref:hypothetical protein n=1 Tax=Actinoplanes sp. CA-142083 TaxID=3239903 RepID=UPI003D8E0F65
MTAPIFYARPTDVGNALPVAPALASWDKAGSPGQVRSAAFIGGVHKAVDEMALATPDPLALRLSQLAFVVGPRRAWPNLWKATIDSLGSIQVPPPAQG